MATIITQLERTTGNYQDTFLYTLNASFNGIEGAVTDARIEFFLPNFCEISLGDLEYPVRDLRTEPRTGGTQYIIDFGTLEDTGVSVRIGFGIVFARIAENGASYTLSPEFWLNGTLEEQTPAAAITLVLAPRFEVRKEVVLPTADPAAGGFVYYLVTLQNFGDLGARIENVAIEAFATVGLTIDESFAIIGKDASTANFTDTTMDGVQGRVADGIVSFDIASYRGEIYTFLYRAILAETLTIGQTLETEIRWQSADDTQGQASVPHTLTLGAPSESLSLSLYGADYALGGDSFAYEWRMNNTGNQVLTATRCLLTLTQGITYTTLRTGSFQRRALGEVVDAAYQINYTTAAGTSGVLGSYNMGVSQNVDLGTVVAAGDNILTLEWVFTAYGIGVRQRTVPRLLGMVVENIADGTVLESTATASWQVGIAGAQQGERTQQNATQQTEIANTCVLQPSFSASVGNAPQRPGDAFRYTISAYAYRSALRGPVFAVLLPAVLSYQGEASLTLSGIFGDAVPALPPVSVTQNYNAAGDTLVQFAFVGEYACTIRQLSRLNLSFFVAVKIGARGSFAASGLLNAAVGSGEVASNSTPYAESEAAASALGLAFAAPYAQTAVLEQQILFFVATSAQKQVRGLIDTTFAGIGGTGQTVSGGAAWYALTVRNIGNADLQTVELVDILPYVGDTAVLSPGTARKSEFTLSLLSEIAAAVIDGATGQEVAEVPFTISYTTSTDPLRFGGSFNTIGTVDAWQTDFTSPEDAQLQSVAALKVRCSTPLLPGQSLLVLIATTTPATAPTGATAWNSFAARVTYDDADGVRQTMLATEASKAGLLIQPIEVLQATLPKAQKRLLSDVLRANRSARSVMRNVIYNQMLIGMKHEEVLDLIDI